MGRNESTVKLLVKVWEGIREFLEVPNESMRSLLRLMRVRISHNLRLRIGTTQNDPFPNLVSLAYHLQWFFIPDAFI